MKFVRKYIFIFGTLLLVVAIEGSRLSGKPFPIPFLLIFLSLVVSANLGGVRSGMASAFIGSSYVWYSSTTGFGPGSLTGGALQVILGVVLFFSTTWLLGRTTEQNRSYLRELRDQERDLQSQVKDRTKSLQESHERERDIEDQLRQSQKMDAVGQLTGGIAHDFNNLLLVIQGNAELLRSLDKLNLQAHSHIEEIIDAGTRGASLVSRLLTFSRQQSLQPETLDVEPLIDGVASLIERTLGRNIGLTIDVDSSIWRIIVDRVQLENAILNLAINGRDAMPDGGQLTIRATNMQVDANNKVGAPDIPIGAYVALSIADTGLGIGPTVLDRIFEPFFTTKPIGKGTGLGLSMVYGFAKQSNGGVGIESEPGNGAVITLYLPRSLGEMSPDQPELEGAVAQGESEKILCVEDDLRVRRVCVEMLEAGGYDVVAVESGPQALEFLNAGNRIDLLFTDIMMPGGMSGIELAEAALLIDRSIAVLFTTGYAKDAALKKWERLGVGDSVLPKPYKSEELYRRVQQALTESKD